MRRVLPLALLAVALVPAEAARAAEVPEGATWSEATIESTDGVQLHADILRPKGLPKKARTPVILSIGPYFSHSGQTGVLGPVQGTGTDPVGPSAGPSERFHDFIEGAKLFERGYSFVMVDLRGFGGSSGCLDWMGPGEQADVKAAVEWAASRPWSTGSVGMYGKSYDAVTGLAGAVMNPTGLKAVVAQEPVYDMYRYLFSNGVRFANSLGTPALYNAIAGTPGPLLDSPQYNVNSVNDPACLADNYASQQDPDHTSDYWQARNLLADAGKARVPLFLTQGFLENNTKPDGAFAFFNRVKAPKRAWYGMWDHVRGNDVDDEGRLLMGRKGFFDEVMRFFDHHVRGVPLADAPVHEDPPVVVQTSDGTWRGEERWPPADTRMLRTELLGGSYLDDGNNNGTGAGAGNGLWTISPPLGEDAHYAGVPTVSLKVATTGTRNEVVVDTYDIAPDGEAILLSRNASLIPADGKVRMELYGNDWKIPAGHRLGVLVTGSNAEWWLHAPAPQELTLESGTIRLPFLTYRRTETIQGDPAVRLEEWLEEAPFEVPAETIQQRTAPGFGVPAPLTVRPEVPGGGSSEEPAARRLKVRVARTGRRIAVYGNAPSGVKLTVRLRRALTGAGARRGARARTRTVRTRRLTTTVNAFRTTFRVRRAGHYRALVAARVDGRRVVARSRAVRVR